jgi:hypothetical protein
MTVQKHRDFLNALVEAIQADVPASADWEFHLAAPVQHTADGPHCAVWWEAETPADEFNTSGSMDIVSTFQLRYWEPTPELASGLVVDEDRALELEQTFEDVKAVVFANQDGLGGWTYQTWYRGGRMLVGGGDEQAVQGFELAVMCRGQEEFTGP